MINCSTETLYGRIFLMFFFFFLPFPHNTVLSFTASGLLRLLRPLQWQHLHVPLLPMSCRHVLKHAVDVKEPFLIGTYTSVLER